VWTGINISQNMATQGKFDRKVFKLLNLVIFKGDENE